MTPPEVYSFFRSLIDEDDTTFLTQAQANEMLKESYTEFRDLVNSIEPDVYSQTDLITLVDTNSYDLTVADTVAPNNKFLSSAAGTATANKHMARLIRVARIDSPSTNNVVEWLVPVPNVEQLVGGDYARQGNTIRFGYSYNTTLRIEYVPFHTVDFVTSTFLDNLDQFHPLIALMAAKYYEIRDGAENVALERKRQEKIKELRTWLTRFWKGGIAQRTVG